MLSIELAKFSIYLHENFFWAEENTLIYKHPLYLLQLYLLRLYLLLHKL
jgi:hypothetical protein